MHQRGGDIGAHALAQEGFNIAINGSSDRAACERVAKECEKLGAKAIVVMGDVGKAEDSTAIQYNVVTIDGQPSVYIPVLKQGGANTISVVDGIHEMLPKVIGMPSGMKLKAIRFVIWLSQKNA